VAEPRSPHSRLDRSHRVCPNREARQQDRPCGDLRDDAAILPTHLKNGAHRGDVVRGLHRGAVVTAGRKAGRLSGGIDAPHLHRHRCESGNAQRQNGRQRGDGESSLDGDSAAIGG
jgi:hypothetical protein